MAGWPGGRGGFVAVAGWPAWAGVAVIRAGRMIYCSENILRLKEECGLNVLLFNVAVK